MKLISSAIKNGKSAWNEGGKQLRDGAKYVEDNYGDVINDGWNQVKSMAQFLRDQIVLAWKKILPHLKDAWEASKPFFHQLGKFIIEKSLEVWNYLQTNFPVYMEMLSQTTADLVQFTAQCWQKITEVRIVQLKFDSTKYSERVDLPSNKYKNHSILQDQS